MALLKVMIHVEYSVFLLNLKCITNSGILLANLNIEIRIYSLNVQPYCTIMQNVIEQAMPFPVNAKICQNENA